MELYNCLPTNVCPMSTHQLPNLCIPNVCPTFAQHLPNVCRMFQMSASECPRYRTRAIINRFWLETAFEY